MADRTKATTAGGIGLIHRMVKVLGLDQAINRHVNLLKFYMPYAESDHVPLDRVLPASVPESRLLFCVSPSLADTARV